MKKNLVFILLIFSLQLIAQNITSDLEVWYKFDYTPGDVLIKDYSGNGRDLISTNGLDSNFSWGSSQIASGVNNYVQFPTGRDLNACLTSSDNKNWWGIWDQRHVRLPFGLK